MVEVEPNTPGRQLSPSVRPVLSVVVMAYRNERTIVDAVHSVLSQETAESIEVIVVTSGRDDASKLVRDAFPDVAVVESPRRLLPGATRNAGLAAASGQIVAFLAADCRAEPGWLVRRLADHRGGHPAVASAITHAGPSRPWAWGSYYLLYHERLPGRPAGVVSPPDPAVHSLSFDRALLDRIGPFDESLRIGEDTDVAQRLADLGVEIWFDPAIHTAHLEATSFWFLVRDHFRRGARRYRSLVLAGRRRPSRSLTRVLGGNVLRFARRTPRTLATCWRYAPGDERWRVTLSLPFVIAFRAAAAAGMASEELKAARAAHTSIGDGLEPFRPRPSSKHAPSQ
jgi:glycosyltransferase involved in cell wall biosynthesis